MVAFGTWAPITALHSPSRREDGEIDIEVQAKVPGADALGKISERLLNIPPTVIIAYRDRQFNGT